MRRTAALVFAAITAAGPAACGGSGPTSPGAGSQPPPIAQPAPTPGPHVVTGAVLSVIDDAAAGVVSFTVNGTLVGRSEANGAFSVGFHDSGVNRTVLAAPGFVDRQTGIAAPGADRRLTLIPSSFDLASFNQMFRHTAVSGGTGLTRWTQPPALVIERRVLQFTTVGAPTYEALEETLTDDEVNGIIADLVDGYALLTAGRLGTFSSISTQLTPAGGTVAVSQPGRILVTRQVGLTQKENYWGYARWATTADGEVSRGFIILDDAFERSGSPFRRSLRMHELGHTLGCQHVDAARPSVMNSHARNLPNDFDRHAARIAMLRPTGNRTPDIDPASHSATTFSHAAQPPLWHGAH